MTDGRLPHFSYIDFISLTADSIFGGGGINESAMIFSHFTKNNSHGDKLATEDEYPTCSPPFYFIKQGRKATLVSTPFMLSNRHLT